MDGLEVVNGVAQLQVYSQEKQLYSTDDTDLGHVNSQFSQLNQTAKSFKLGPLQQMVVFGKDVEVAEQHNAVVVCSKAPTLEKAYLVQTIYSTCAGE